MAYSTSAHTTQLCTAEYLLQKALNSTSAYSATATVGRGQNFYYASDSGSSKSITLDSFSSELFELNAVKQFKVDLLNDVEIVSFLKKKEIPVSFVLSGAEIIRREFSDASISLNLIEFEEGSGLYFEVGTSKDAKDVVRSTAGIDVEWIQKIVKSKVGYINYFVVLV